jgi:hypothetical protein
MGHALEIPLLALSGVLLIIAREKRWVSGWLVAGLATVTAVTALVAFHPAAFHGIRTEKVVILLALGLPFAGGIGILLRQLPVVFGVCAAIALLVSLSGPAMGSASVSLARYVLAAVPALIVLGASGVER